MLVVQLRLEKKSSERDFPAPIYISPSDKVALIF
jgi:hypothetical protein